MSKAIIDDGRVECKQLSGVEAEQIANQSNRHPELSGFLLSRIIRVLESRLFCDAERSGVHCHADDCLGASIADGIALPVKLAWSTGRNPLYLLND